MALNKQLSEQGLGSIDVISDGNCLFRAVSTVIYGSENRHGYLRQQAANIVAESGCILDGLTDTSPDDNHSFAEHLKIIRTPGKAVGEDMIIVLAKFCNCCIKVQIAYSEPLVYQPLTSVVSDYGVNFAFYKSGRYIEQFYRSITQAKIVTCNLIELILSLMIRTNSDTI